jgi:hypothetical protein
MPETATADPKPALDCTPAILPATVPALNAQVQGGVLLLPNLNVNVNLRINQSLVLQSIGQLTFGSQILLDQMAADTVSVTMIAINGDVVVQPGALIELCQPWGNGNNARAQQANALATATAGFNGGYIRILAPQGSIIIDGELRAGMGGEGGEATASGTQSASALAGQGGFGGDIYLCADRDIIVRAPLSAGPGGQGGFARAKVAFPGAGACSAKGGAGNDGGSIHFAGTGAAVTSVTLSARVVAGQGGDGEKADATGGAAATVGGPGGAGGTVTFTNCAVISHGIVQAGNGGRGGNGTSTSGIGGLGGLNATANGGNGGATGPAPTIPQPLGLPPVPGTIDGSGGAGGNAVATGGHIPFLPGGGSGTATGGTGASSATAAPTTTATPTATSAGTP